MYALCSGRVCVAVLVSCLTRVVGMGLYIDRVSDDIISESPGLLMYTVPLGKERELGRGKFQQKRRLFGIWDSFSSV